MFKTFNLRGSTPAPGFYITCRIRGMVFNPRHTWRHVSDLILDCRTRLNLLKTFSSPRWGASSNRILQILHALIQAKLDHGAVIYDSGSSHSLQTLEPILNAANRMSLGAFCTSPVDSFWLNPALCPCRKFLCLSYGLELQNRQPCKLLRFRSSLGSSLRATSFIPATFGTSSAILQP